MFLFITTTKKLFAFKHRRKVSLSKILTDSLMKLYNCTIKKKGRDEMDIVIDTSAIIAVITNEIHKSKLVSLTQGTNLIAPESLHWEIGNAFSAMLKRQRITLQQAQKAVSLYERIPLRFVNIKLDLAIQLATTHKIYAYDAYFIACAMQMQRSLLSLDKSLLNIAQQCGVKIIGV